MQNRMLRLLRVIEKKERFILGMMSGTSMDGLDLALCRVSGSGIQTKFEILNSKTIPYAREDREKLGSVVSQEVVVLRDLCILNAWLAERHASWVLASLEEWGVPTSQVDVIASHGQTIYHAPGSWKKESHTRHATMQIGDGDLIAVRTGIITLSDFRQKEIAGGGEGAPIAPYAETLVFAGATPRILLNIGGIANFTWLPPKGAGVLSVFGDTGPGNSLIDRAVRMLFPENEDGYDKDGLLARQGTVSNDLLEWLLSDPYFKRRHPKSTGPETYGDTYMGEAWEHAQTLALSPLDFIATLTRLTAETIGDALSGELPSLSNTHLYGSGGGWKNPMIKRWLKERLPEPKFHDVDELGVPAEAKEAVLFAMLANESLCGEGFIPLMRGDEGRRYSFGKISLPD
ncbi:MAG: anhydro-N-acetylmuramic acid kinase [Deltaproteobacteria bacterium]|nr:anhydro-N-acetylmuramic acid kinase [Deltaproteobacteria bacterium]